MRPGLMGVRGREGRGGMNLIWSCSWALLISYPISVPHFSLILFGCPAKQFSYIVSLATRSDIGHNSGLRDGGVSPQQERPFINKRQTLRSLCLLPACFMDAASGAPAARQLQGGSHRPVMPEQEDNKILGSSCRPGEAAAPVCLLLDLSSFHEKNTPPSV